MKQYKLPLTVNKGRRKRATPYKLPLTVNKGRRKRATP
jgi:hypothetical protein